MPSLQRNTGRASSLVFNSTLPYDWRRGLFAALAWLITAQLSQFHPFAGIGLAVFWPPDGIAIGLTLAYGLRILPPIGGAVLAWNLARGMSPGMALLGCFSLLLALVVALYLVRRDLRDHQGSTPVTAMLRYHALTIIPPVLILSLLGGWQFALNPGPLDTATVILAVAISEILGILLFARFSELAAYELENWWKRARSGGCKKPPAVFFWLIGLLGFGRWLCANSRSSA